MAFEADHLKQASTRSELIDLARRHDIPIDRTLRKLEYEAELNQLQIEMVNLQKWVARTGRRLAVIFEGRDAAGKGGAIRRLTERINPRHYRIVALNVPTEDERKQWFFQRYISQLPNPGEMVFFDRSWYNRAVVEPVNGFCTEDEYEIFMSQVNEFEKMLIQSDTHLIKIYFSITKKEQASRFKDIKGDPLKKWKMTAVDERAQELWDDYTSYKERMFEKTDSEHAPWKVIDANDKAPARLETIQYILGRIPYK
jgi:polyphosphate kinase 2